MSASALARLSGLLLPTINVLWIEKVQALNPVDDVPDFASYLFGYDRTALRRVGDARKESFGKLCFYCQIRPAGEVDHVIPWSRAHLDSLANLVPACRKCNADKADLLPIPRHLGAAIARDHGRLDAIAADLNWPTEYDRVRTVAHGIYKIAPDHTPAWVALDELEPLDPATMAHWLNV